MPAQPTNVLETEAFRVTRMVIDRSDVSMSERHKEQLDDILIEERRKDARGELYWHPLCHLFQSRSGATKDEQLMLRVLNQFPIESPQAGARATVAMKPLAAKTERRAALAALVVEVGKTLTGDVEMTASMPFDNRDGNMGLSIAPSTLDKLRALFPGFPYPVHPVQLVGKLLEHAALELQAAAE